MKTIIILCFAITFNILQGQDLTEHWRNVDYFANITFMDLSCPDSLNCIACGNLYGSDGPVIRRSTDGGNSWHTIWADTSIFYFDSLGGAHYSYRPKYQIASVSYPSKDLILAGFTRGRMLRSINGGATWDTITFKSSKSIRLISMFNSKFGVALNDTNLYITKDGGLSWDMKMLPDSSSRFMMYELFTPSEGKIIIHTGNLGKILNSYLLYQSDDFGEHWSMTPFNSKIHHIFYLNERLMWGCGGYSINDTVNSKTTKYGQIYYSTDGGKSWNIQLDLDSSFINKDLFYSISFADSLNGIATQVQVIWKTTDGGKNWIRQTKPVYTGSYIDNGTYLTSFKQGNAIVTGWEVKTYKYFEEPQGVNESKITIDNILIIPNPASDFITININNVILIEAKSRNEVETSEAHPQIKIYDIFGQEEHPPTPSYKEGEIKIDVSALPAGVYFVRVGDKVSKFVKVEK